ncbi:MAG: YitT family protein [Ruminococcus sp.]|nr:YitT family protein [Ruminococcus sp.]
MKNTDRVRQYAADYLLMILGAVLYALSVSYFTAPNDIAPGGLTGIATMLNHLFSIPIGTTVLLLNIPLFIWGAIENGRRFILRTIIATAFVSLLIDLFQLPDITYHGDRMIAAVFGGILSGTGLGFILLRGGSTGGTDIIARNLNRRFPYLSIGRIVLISDAVVVALSAVVYGNIENALYAVIAIFTSSKLIDAVVFGLSRDNGKLMIVITSLPDEVTSVLTTKVNRGVTVLSAYGGYSRTPRGVILCAVRPHDAYRVKAAVTETDSEAFIITVPATAISGLGFSLKEKP